MSELNDFLVNPPEFMRRNHVRFCGSCALGAGDRGRFVLLRMDRRHARRSNVFLGMAVGRRDAGVFQIRHATAYQPADGTVLGSFEAVWSGYQASGAVQCALAATDPSIMLTPELTGCTVVCAPGPDGTARFSHYNLRDPEQPTRTLDAAAMHARAASDYAGSPHAVLTRETYYGKSVRGAPRATVVGWRTGGAWTFWIQYVEETDQVFKIRDVQQMRPGTRFG